MIRVSNLILQVFKGNPKTLFRERERERERERRVHLVPSIVVLEFCTQSSLKYSAGVIL